MRCCREVLCGGAARRSGTGFSLYLRWVLRMREVGKAEVRKEIERTGQGDMDG